MKDADTCSSSALDSISFYEDDAVLASYLKERDRADGPKLAIEEQIVLRFLGNLTGCSVLDLGCGDARIGRAALRAGALHYVGLDGSRRMIELARQSLIGTSGVVRLQNLENWRGEPAERFDIVVSQLALQYITNLSHIFEAVRKQLKPRGIFVFSVEHPLITSSFKGQFENDIAASWCVRRYFREGSRVNAWLNSAVVKQHRTLQTYFAELRRCGFQLDRFSEGWPDPDNFPDRAIYEQRLEVPICAIFRARLEQ